MKRLRVLGFVASASLCLTLSQVSAWDIAMADAPVDGVARNLNFKAALVLDIGNGAEFVISCNESEDFAIQLAFPKVENLLIPDDDSGSFHLFDGDRDILPSNYGRPVSYSDNDVTLNLGGGSAEQVAPVLRNIAAAETGLTFKFDGLFGWEVTARPPYDPRTSATFSEFMTKCTSLQKLGLSQSPDPATQTLTLEDALLDRWLYDQKQVTITDCTIVADVNPTGTLIQSDLDWIKSVTEDATAKGYVVSPAGPGTIIVSPSDDIPLQQYQEWLTIAVLGRGGAIAGENDPSDIAPVRVTAPNFGNIANLDANEILQTQIACRAPDADYEAILLDPNNMAHGLLSWAIANCNRMLGPTVSEECHNKQVTGTLAVGNSTNLLNANNVENALPQIL